MFDDSCSLFGHINFVICRIFMPYRPMVFNATMVQQEAFVNIFTRLKIKLLTTEYLKLLYSCMQSLALAGFDVGSRAVSLLNLPSLCLPLQIKIKYCMLKAIDKS
jgi:hypothetical protein